MDNVVVIIQRDDKWDPRRKKYFHPRFVKVLPGQEIRWINHDTKNHRLVSGNPDTLISDGIFDTGEILMGNAGSIQFNSSQEAKSIPYFCLFHPNERGTVVILPMEEDSLTNDERLELLESTFAFDNSAEFKKMHTSLEKYVDPVVLEQIRDPELVTMQNKILTIVFWDISGFSVLCESLQFHQELVVAFLREFFSEAATIIHKYDGVLDKFMGDGIMAFFGFKDTHVSDNGKKGAICAVNAALELRDFFEEIKVDWIDLWKARSSQKEEISIHLRCGMNTGNVLVGLILTEKRDQFTTIGTNVNLASRMEGVATEDQIIISPATKMQIEDIFNFRSVPIKRTIKGFENIAECYEILSKRDRASIN
ncbi:MAG TPA: adenylate/guanylate cyclase domain-containing protein [Nitrososphaeraceae archaeon]|nr:adenylate/guanylate cyclase domain-containing protein [Nitrososphaeraceae archaeon]